MDIYPTNVAVEDALTIESDIDDDDEYTPSAGKPHQPARKGVHKSKDNAVINQAGPKRPIFEKMDWKTLEHYCEGFWNDKTKAEAELKDMRKKRTKDRKFGEEQRKGRIAAEKEVKMLKQEIYHLRHVKEEQTEDYRISMDELKDNFAEARKEWSQQVSAKIYPCLPDNVIRAKFHELLDRCNQWFRQWYDASPTDAAMESLGPVLASCCEGGDPAIQARLGRKPLSRDRTTIRTLGFAWTIRHILSSAFGNPFFMFEEREKALSDLFRDHNQDKRKARDWRAETVRLFRHNHGVEPLELRSDTSKTKTLTRLGTKHAESLISNMDVGLLRSISKEDARKRLRNLATIYLEFILLALELRSQKCGLQLLEPTRVFKQLFSNQSKLHEPYVGMGVDDDGTIFEGMMIHMVLVPAIQSIGDADGSNSQKSKVLSRAIVYIFEDLLLQNIKEMFDGTLPEPSVSQAGRSRDSLLADDEEQSSPKRRKMEENAPVTTATDDIVQPTITMPDELPPAISSPLRSTMESHKIDTITSGGASFGELVEQAKHPAPTSTYLTRRKQQERAKQHDKSFESGAVDMPASGNSKASDTCNEDAGEGGNESVEQAQKDKQQMPTKQDQRSPATWQAEAERSNVQVVPDRVVGNQGEEEEKEQRGAVGRDDAAQDTIVVAVPPAANSSKKDMPEIKTEPTDR